MIAAFAVLMASVSLFTYVQIARNAHQTHQRRLSRAHDALTPTLSLTRRVARHTNPATAGLCAWTPPTRLAAGKFHSISVFCIVFRIV